MVKKAVFLFIAGMISLLVVSPANAQVSNSGKAPVKNFKFTIKTNPMAALGGPFWVIIVPVTGEYKAIFEAKLAKKVSFQFGASYLGPSVLINLDKITTDSSGISGLKTSGYKFSGILKYFLSRDLEAPQGFYIGPHVSYASAKLADKANTNNYVNGTKLNVNAVIGYQMITSGGFTLDIFTGMGYVSRKWSYNSTQTQDKFDLGANKSSVSIPLGISFGYAF